MQFLVRLWLVAFTTLAVAQSWPMLSGRAASNRTSEMAYAGPDGPAIDGAWALHAGARFVGDALASRGHDPAGFNTYLS